MSDAPPVYVFSFWRGMQPADAAAMFADAPFVWWIAGGHAIDLFLGRTTREHEDLDVALFHDDHPAAFELITRHGYELHAADPPGTLRPWTNAGGAGGAAERLSRSIHDIWCRRGPDQPWEFQLMLNPRADDGSWVSRRDPSFVLPLSQAVRLSASGIPCLAPEIQLHFKAKSMRPKDEADFAAALPALSDSQRAWLRDALRRTYPGHAWIDAIR